MSVNPGIGGEAAGLASGQADDPSIIPLPSPAQKRDELINKMLALTQKWAALKQDVTQTRLKEMRNMNQYAMTQDKVRVAFERQTKVVSILSTIDATGSDGILLQPVYGNSAMADLPNRGVGPPDRDTILRKNILYLAHSVEYVTEFCLQLTQIGFLTLFDKDEIEQHDADLPRCVALLVKLFQKELTTNIVSRLVGVLYLTANTAAADILMEAKRLAEQADTPLDLSPKKAVALVAPEVPPRRRVELEAEVAQAAGGSNPADEWTCANCTLINLYPSTVCAVCFKTKDFQNPGNIIQCEQCTYLNPPRQLRCEMCETPLTDPLREDKEDTDDDDDDDDGLQFD